MTALHRNPFALLDATTRDDRRRLVELAEARSLEGDQAVFQKARADLTNPRSRLAAELAWLPGVSPKRATQLLAELTNDPLAIRRASGVPPLAFANLLAGAFERATASHREVDMAKCVAEFAAVLDTLNPEAILRDVNEDRAISGFPRVQDVEAIESVFVERKRYYRDAVKTALNELAPATLVDAMTRIVDDATDSGAVHAPALVDELVDSYALEAQQFLTKETENVQKLLKGIRDHASSGETAIRPLVERLGAVVRNWDLVAQPIQLSAKARGTQHEPSRDLAIEIRSVGIDLFNHHDLLESARHITELLQEVFAEVPEVFERLEQDASAIEDIAAARVQASKDREEFTRNITYEVDVGLIFKDKLRISPDGIEWKDVRRPLESITRVRWGGVRRSINGIPSGTSYTIGVGDSETESVIELSREETYNAFLERLWPAVCARLSFEHVQALKGGHPVRMGEAILRDGGVELVKHKVFGANEWVRLPWTAVHVWSADGSFFIGAKDDKKTYAQLSYIEVPNVHLIEFLIRQFFKTPCGNLSEAFTQ